MLFAFLGLSYMTDFVFEQDCNFILIYTNSQFAYLTFVSRLYRPILLPCCSFPSVSSLPSNWQRNCPWWTLLKVHPIGTWSNLLNEQLLKKTTRHHIPTTGRWQPVWAECLIMGFAFDSIFLPAVKMRKQYRKIFISSFPFHNPYVIYVTGFQLSMKCHPKKFSARDMSLQINCWSLPTFYALYESTKNRLC